VQRKIEMLFGNDDRDGFGKCTQPLRDFFDDADPYACGGFVLAMISTRYSFFQSAERA
jgi:hypothetical protein